MSWRQMFHFMEKMGVGLKKERVKQDTGNNSSHGGAPLTPTGKQFQTSKPDASGLETTFFVLNQLRSVLGNRKPKRRKGQKNKRNDSETSALQMLS